MTGQTAGFVMLSCVMHLIGVGVERWLFFAEAEHVVALYYGKG
jgi:DMSO reductase anchor subunit